MSAVPFAFYVSHAAGFRPADIGIRFTGWPFQILIAPFGMGLGYIEYLILRPEPLANALTLQQVWLLSLILIVITGLLEEVIFRGLMQKAFINGFGPRFGLLFVSTAFAVLHLGYCSVPDLLLIFYRLVIRVHHTPLTIDSGCYPDACAYQFLTLPGLPILYPIMNWIALKMKVKPFYPF